MTFGARRRCWKNRNSRVICQEKQSCVWRCGKNGGTKVLLAMGGGCGAICPDVHDTHLSIFVTCHALRSANLVRVHPIKNELLQESCKKGNNLFSPDFFYYVSPLRFFVRCDLYFPPQSNYQKSRSSYHFSQELVIRGESAGSPQF